MAGGIRDGVLVDEAVADAPVRSTMPTAPAPVDKAPETQPQPEAVEAARGAVSGNPYDQFDGGGTTSPNVYDQFDTQAPEKPGLWEQARLASQESYYRGTLMGAFDMARRGMPVSAIDNDPNLTPEQKESWKTYYRKQGNLSDVVAEKQNKVREDLTKWEALPSYDGPLEAAARLGGMFYGGMWSPEAYILRPVKAAGAAAGFVGRQIARVPGAGLVSAGGAKVFGAGTGAAAGRVAVEAAETGAGLAIVQAATDPAVQGLSIYAQTQAEYDPMRTMLAPFMGFGFGAGLHAGGAAVGAAAQAAGRRLASTEGKAFADAGTRAAGVTEPLGRTEPVPPKATFDPLPDNGETIPGLGVVTEIPPEPVKPSAAAETARTQMAEASTNPAAIPQAGAGTAIPDTPGQPAGVFRFKAGELTRDPERFQFKGGVDADGENGKLANVKTWDQAKGNQLIVWEDASGKRFVADGHQRTGLAQRLDPNIEIPGLLLRERDGFSAADAMVMGAEKNVAEGSGGLMDAAKIMRMQPEVGRNLEGISDLRIRQAGDLAKLGDEAWREVVKEGITPEYGSIVGRVTSDPARQLDAINVIQHFEPRNADEATILARRTVSDTQSLLNPAVMDEVRIQAAAAKVLKGDKALMRTLLGQADTIEEAGVGTVAREAAGARSAESDALTKYLAARSIVPGELKGLLTQYAEDVRLGTRTHADAATAFVSDARRAIRSDAERRALPGAEGPNGSGGGGTGRGADGSGGSSGANDPGQRGGGAEPARAAAPTAADLEAARVERTRESYGTFQKGVTRKALKKEDPQERIARDAANEATLREELNIPATVDGASPEQAARIEQFGELTQILRYAVPAAREAGDTNGTRRLRYQAAKLFDRLSDSRPPTLAETNARLFPQDGLDGSTGGFVGYPGLGEVRDVPGFVAMHGDIPPGGIPGFSEIKEINTATFFGKEAATDLKGALDAAAAGDTAPLVAALDEAVPRPPVNRDGIPATRVYHGTNAGDIREIDMTRLDPDALYGPGFYMTESPVLASSYTLKPPLEGAIQDADRIAWPNVMPLDVRFAKPFDMDIPIVDADLRLLAEAISKKEPLTFTDGMDKDHPDFVMFDIMRELDEGQSTLPRDFKFVYDSLKYDTEAAGTYKTITDYAGEFGNEQNRKKWANELLRDAGFDGIKHTGGAGDRVKHKVWIALDPEAVRFAYAQTQVARELADPETAAIAREIYGNADTGAGSVRGADGGAAPRDGGEAANTRGGGTEPGAADGTAQPGVGAGRAGGVDGASGPGAAPGRSRGVDLRRPEEIKAAAAGDTAPLVRTLEEEIPAPVPAPGEAPTTRVYHGTQGVIDRFDATRFNDDSLFGPGIYLTEDPSIASSYALNKASYGPHDYVSDVATLRKYFEPEARLPNGDRVKAFEAQDDGSWRVGIHDSGWPNNTRWHRTMPSRRDVEFSLQDRGLSQPPSPNVMPLDVRLAKPFDMDKPILSADADAVLAKLVDSVLTPAEAARIRALTGPGDVSGKSLWDSITQVMKDANEGYVAKSEINAALKAAGFDGIKHTGGLSAAYGAGKPHQVWIMFDSDAVQFPYIRSAVVRELRDPETAAIAKEVYGESTPAEWRQAADAPAAAARGDGAAAEGGGRTGEGSGAQGGPAAAGGDVRSAGADLDPQLQFRGKAIVQPVDAGAPLVRPFTGTPQPPPAPIPGPGGRPPAPANPAHAPASAEVKSLYQQALDLSDAVGGTLRAGRVQRGALGQYDTRQGVMRVRAIADYETVAHEVGHHLEDKVGAPLKQYIAANAQDLGRLDAVVGQLNPREGFAEATRIMSTNPQWLKANEPGIDASIRNFLKTTQPEIMDAIDKGAAAYKAYIDAPSGMVVRANVVDRNMHEGILASIKHEGIIPTIRLGMTALYDRAFDHLNPVNLTVRDIARSMRDKNGGTLIDLKHAEDPNTLLRLAQRSHQAGVQDLMDGVRSYADPLTKGPSLRGALIVAMGDPRAGIGEMTVGGLKTPSLSLAKWNPEKTADFSAYLVARRAEYMWRKFEGGLLQERPVGFSKGDAIQAMTDFETKYPTFKAGGDMTHDFGRALLQKQFDGGLINKDLFDKLMAEEFYVPLYRNMRDRPLDAVGSSGVGRGSGPKGPGMTDTVKRFKGSDREIIDPIQGFMTQTFLVNRTLAHNDAVVSLAGLAKQAGAAVGHLVEEIPAKSLQGTRFNVQDAMRNAARSNGLDPLDTQHLMSAVVNAFGDDPVFGSLFSSVPTKPGGEPIIFYKVGGELRALRLASKNEGRALYEAFVDQPQAINDMWVRMVGFTAKTLRSGVTTNPMFAITNFIRDQIAVGILRPDYIPFYHGLKGTWGELRQNDMAKLYAYHSGVSPGAAVGSVDHIVEGGVQDLAKKGYFVNRLSSIHGLMELAGVTESGTRVGVFKQVYDRELARGRTPQEAGVAAAYEATDLLDFSRHGSRTGIAMKLIPFLNAAWQATDKARRVMVEPLTRKLMGDIVTVQEQAGVKNALLAWSKFLGVGGTLGFFWAMLNSQQDSYVNADPRLKATHLIVPIGGSRVFLVPKPFELGIGINAGEEAYARFVQGDQRADDRMLEAISETLIEPFNPKRWVEGTPGLKTYFELQTGKSLFTHRDIVPADLRGLSPAEQWDARSSEISKALGSMTNTSPKKWDYAAGSLFGSYGKDIASASTMANPDAPELPIDQMIFARRLIKSTTNGSDITNKFWNQIAQNSGTYAQAKTTFDSLSAQNNDGRAQAFLARQPDPVRAFVTLTAASDEDTGKLVFSAADRMLHPLTRASEAGRVVLGLTKELRTNQQRDWEEGERQVMTPQLRGQVIDALQTLSMLEQRNALIINKEPGYEKQKIIDPQAQFEVIKAISPFVAQELATRYATAKIPTTASIVQTWPEAQRRLVADGGQAEIAELTQDVTGEGTAFDGDAVKKPGKRKGIIDGKGAAPRQPQSTVTVPNPLGAAP